MKNVLLVTATCLALVSCKKDDSSERSAAPATPTATEVAPGQGPAPAPTPASKPTSGEPTAEVADTPTGEGVGSQATGIPACDEYLDKYQACLEAKVPESARAAMKDAFAAQRDAWRQSAEAAKGNDAMREQLSKNCSEALTAARAPMQQYGCEW